MRIKNQSVAEIVDNLSGLDVDWMDETAANAIAKMTAIEHKDSYTRDDIVSLLDGDFEEGYLCVRTFLGLSADSMYAALREKLGVGGTGVTRFNKDREAYLDALVDLGLLDAMEAVINRKPVWSDILIERLRSGRGSAISGQKRGRGLEDFAEALVKEVFGEGGYELRCSFTGATGREAKCDVAIPNKADPRILIESKGYGATGSKMSDVIGDLDAIIEHKRRDTPLLFLTDGLTWKDRLSDLGKIVERQNRGDITRIYTTQMRDEFLADLKTLKDELGL